MGYQMEAVSAIADTGFMVALLVTTQSAHPAGSKLHPKSLSQVATVYTQVPLKLFEPDLGCSQC